MQLDRKENAKQGILFGMINKVCMLVFPFLVQTITIRMLGMQYVGIKGLFSSILTVLSLAELGMGSAIVYSMYKPIAVDDQKMICALLNLYKKIYRITGLVILIIGLALLPLLKLLIKGAYPEDINIYIVFIMYLLNTVLTYWLFGYKTSLLIAFQRNDIVSKISIYVSLGTSLCQIVVLLITKNFYLYLTTALAFTIINNLLISKWVGNLFPTIKPTGKVPDSILSDIKKKVSGLFIGQICGVTRNTFDNIFISMFLGLSQVAIYSNYYSILSTLIGFTSIVLSSLLGGIGNSIVMESKEKNYNDMLKINFIYMIISGWMTICMVCLYQPFMQLWAGKENIYPNYIMILFPIYFYLRTMGDIRSVYADAAGLFWENRHRTLVEAIANIVLNYLFVRKWGAFGILLATIISLFVCGVLWAAVVLFKYYFKTGMKNYWLSQLQCTAATLINALITMCVCSRFREGIRAILCRGIICIFVPTVVYALLFFKSPQAVESVKWIRSVLKSKR